MNIFDIQNDIQKKSYYVLVVLILTAILSANHFMLTPRASAATIVHCDPSDGYIRDGSVDQLSLLKAGDGGLNLVHRIFVKFPIPHGTAPSSARLYIFADSSRKDHGAVDDTSPLQNPGLGDLIVYHINDYGTLDAGDFNAPSIGNDPGVLIPGTDTVNVGYISIDITEAMQDDVCNHRSFSSFMIRMETDTDNDDDADFWRFRASRHTDTYTGPYIEYIIPVGGTVMAPRHAQTFTYILLALGIITAAGAFKALTHTYSNPSSRA